MDFKYFIDYKEAKTIRLICIFLPKTCAHRRNFDGTKYVYFLEKDDELLKKIQKNFLKMSEITSKMNLIVNLYTMKKFKT